MSQAQTATPTEIGWNPSALSGIQWLAVVLAAITGAIHLYIFWSEEYVPFLVAGAVFFAAILGLLFNVYPMVLYALGIPFTAGQIVLWYDAGMPSATLGVADKAVQVLLMAVLAYLLYATWQRRQQELMR